MVQGYSKRIMDSKYSRITDVSIFSGEPDQVDIELSIRIKNADLERYDEIMRLYKAQREVRIKQASGSSMYEKSGYRPK